MVIYFSATGNNKYIASIISKETNQKLVSLRELVRNGITKIEVEENEDFGVVMPCYWGIVPTIFLDWLKEAEILLKGNNYRYFVGTYGADFGRMFSAVMGPLKKKDVELDATYSIKTVDNWNPVFDLTDEEFVRSGEKATEDELPGVLASIKEKQKSYVKETRGKLLQKMASRMYEGARKTNKFKVNAEKCIGCGLCERQCPISAIEMNGGKPAWAKEKCTLCLGCVHKCPKNAISYNNQTDGHGQYVNKKVNLDI